MSKQLYELGENVPVGIIPENMYAITLRPDRYGEPQTAMQIEVVKVPSHLSDYEVLVYVMAAGVNYNAIWAGRSKPLDVLKNSQNLDNDSRDYFIPGSDGTGVVWKVGSKVKNVKVGDEVILQSGYFGLEDEKQSYLKPNIGIRAWGYEVNGGTFAQFTRVQSYQCLLKPKYLSWPEAACFMVSAGTAYKMLCHWEPHTVKANEPVLIWGGSGGVGCLAIQFCKAAQAKAIAVVSSEQKGAYCKKIGAFGVINREDFEDWGVLPDIKDKEKFELWRDHIRRFKTAFWNALGEKKNPTIVIEHPGENTFPTSLAVLEKRGMLVTCGGTSGYYGSFDLRQLWVHQKRIQGSHFATREQCEEVIRMISDKKISTCLSEVYPFDKAAYAHQMMSENKIGGGNMAIMVNAK